MTAEARGSASGSPLRDRITRSLRGTPHQTITELCQNLLHDRSRELREEVHAMHNDGLLTMSGNAPHRWALTS
jgi:hypothetical protein